MKIRLSVLTIAFLLVSGYSFAQTSFGSWTLSQSGNWPTGPGISFTGNNETFGISSTSGQVSLQVDGGIRQGESGMVNYFLDKVGLGTTTPSTLFHLSNGVPVGVQNLDALTKLTVDAASGGFMEFRNSADNNTNTGLLFSDNNLGGYVTFRNYPDDRLHIGSYGGIAFEIGTANAVGEKTERMKIDASGRVGIGTSSPDQLLTVNGTIHGKEVKVDLSVPGPDYVFEKSYNLLSLGEVKSYIDENKHLPEVPSAKEMEKNGINVSEMNMLLLKKVEEITLYLLDLQEQNRQLKIAQEEMKILQAELNEIKRNLK